MGLFGKIAQALNSNHENARLARSLTEADVRYLEVLRREIANLIVETDPDLMTRCYQKAWTFEREIAESPQRAVVEEAALVAKFPMIEEFDLIATRHFVPYQKAQNMWSDDDLRERYQEVSRMLVFMRRRQNLPGVGPVHDAKEEKIFTTACDGTRTASSVNALRTPSDTSTPMSRIGERGPDHLRCGELRGRRGRDNPPAVTAGQRVWDYLQEDR